MHVLLLNMSNVYFCMIINMCEFIYIGITLLHFLHVLDQSYDFAMVSDLDEESYDPTLKLWKSYFKRGTLTRNKHTGNDVCM
jgi:hypothetical protein